MDKELVENLIAKHVAEAKLEVSEKRVALILKISGTILGVFGIFIPLWLTNRSTDKVDSAIAEMKREQTEFYRTLNQEQSLASNKLGDVSTSIEHKLDSYKELQDKANQISLTKIDKAILDMQGQFKDLAGIQLRKPILDCFYKNSPIENAELSIYDSLPSTTITIKNSGDAPAQNIRIRLYSNFEKDIALSGEEDIMWRSVAVSDEPSYQTIFESYTSSFRGGQSSFSIDPKDIKAFVLTFPTEQMSKRSHSCLLKIYYEQPEPRKWSFTLTVNKNK